VTQPLDGIRVVDFSTLLPGPLAGLMLAEAGAEVIKVERPGRGDEMRGYEPKLGEDSVNFALLNRGKRSIAIDLKDPAARARLMPLIGEADVLIEQFRPGVMDRLGLGYEALREINRRLIYCSITGYGQSGPKADVAGHDLNYIAETGLLHLAADGTGAPVVPPALIADIGGGTYPAVINILLALQQRARTGQGCRLDIAMCDNLFPLMYWALGNGFAAGRWPQAGDELVTGGSPRYRIYRTADNRFLAVAPLEQRFWERFCVLIGLEDRYRDDGRDRCATMARVAEIIGGKHAAHWQEVFQGEDVCCAIVASLEEALEDPHFRTRGLFEWRLTAAGRTIPAVPVPVAPAFRSTEPRGYPGLGEDDELLGPEPESVRR
jgi:crotonobetainyl-CoA:carnitine CoA-transferase CaiB-like acyl-CoA transferase